MKTVGRIDKDVQKKALRLLKKIEAGEARPIKHKASGYLCVKVGYRHRMIKRNDTWQLMTHERYNMYTNGARNR